MSDLKEIKELVSDVNKTFGELKTELDTTKTRIDALDDLKLDRMVQDMTSKLDTIQTEQRKLEAALNRPQSTEEKSNEFVEKSAKAFDQYLRTGNAGEFKANSEGLEIRAMSTDVNPDGGYLVRPELANFIVDRVFESSPLRQVARVQTIGTKSIEVLIDDDEADASWEGEGAASVSDTDTPELGLKEIVAHKIAADPRITEEQLQDSFLNVEQWLQSKVADKFARTENTAFVSGNGVAKPRGFTTYAAWASPGVYERNKIEQINLGNASDVTANGLISLQNSLKENYQGRAVFGMKRASYGNILKLKGNDQYFFGPQLIKDGQMQLTLLGKPVIFMDDMPAIASSALALVYGDFSVGYTIVDRVGLQVLRDPFTNKGFITYYTRKRVGGDVTNFDAIKIGKIAS